MYIFWVLEGSSANHDLNFDDDSKIVYINHPWNKKNWNTGYDIIILVYDIANKFFQHIAQIIL